VYAIRLESDAERIALTGIDEWPEIEPRPLIETFDIIRRPGTDEPRIENSLGRNWWKKKLRQSIHAVANDAKMRGRGEAKVYCVCVDS
jgi:hypothetical protein